MDFIVFDLETTCWDGNPPTDIREVIEIGAFKMNVYGEVVEEFSAFVKPTYYPNLSPYCKNLTSITQEQINRAQYFPQVMGQFVDWVEDSTNDVFLCAWGKMDKKILQDECYEHSIEFDSLENYLDLKKQYHTIKRSKREYGFHNSLKKEGIEFEGEPHRAKFDAYNLTKLFARYVDQWVY